MATREELIEVREAFAAIFEMPVIKDDTPDAEIEAKIREAVPGLQATDELAEDIQAILIGMDITDFLGRIVPDLVAETSEEQATVAPPNRVAIIAAAKDLNANMDGLDPKIQTVAVKTETLVASVKAAGALVQAGDKISADTRATLLALGVQVAEAVEKPKGKRGRKPAGDKPPKVKKEKGIGISAFLDALPVEDYKSKHEDEFVLAAKKQFPDKPYRVIGNAVYAAFKKKGVSLKK